MITLKKMLLLSCMMVSAITIQAHEKYRIVKKDATYTGDWIIMPDNSIQFTATGFQQAKTAAYSTVVAAVVSSLICSQVGNSNTAVKLMGPFAASAITNYVLSKHILNDGNSGIQVVSTLLGTGAGIFVGLAAARAKAAKGAK